MCNPCNSYSVSILFLVGLAVFRLIYEKKREDGGVERLVQEFPHDDITIGRGGESTVVIPGRRLALVHARMVWDGRSLVVVDAGSVAGVRAEGRRIARENLASGDTIVLGDVSIRCEYANGSVDLICHIDEEEKIQVRAKDTLAGLRVETYLPSMRALCLVVGLAALIGCGLYPFLDGDFSAWSSGPIANPHKLIEADCQKCHTNPFEQVPDSSCLACHSMTEHGSSSMNQVRVGHPDTEKRCAQCHMDHNGTSGLIEEDARQCTTCHANLKQHAKESTFLDVSSFAKHPQFHIALLDSAERTSRISIDSTDAIDPGTIQLNHAVHLEGFIRTRTGEKKLACNSCHELSADFKTIKPISFDTHCRECHSLSFDERDPEQEVPHGDAEVIFPFLYTHYTTQTLERENKPATKTSTMDVSRRIPGSEPVALSVKGSPQELAREAERQLFTKTGCALCHGIDEKPVEERKEDNAHYRIKPSNIKTVWLPHARFSHGAHEEYTCESCHAGVQKSTNSGDVLLPKVGICQNCHADNHRKGFVSSDCVTCHSHHDQQAMAPEKKLDIRTYIRSLIR